MKKLFATLAFSLALCSSAFVSTQSQAQSGVPVLVTWNQTVSWDYLGTTIFQLGCSSLAGSRGYNQFAFGGYVSNGFQWVYVSNACFGARVGVVPQPGASPNYDAYVDQGQDLEACARDIEWYVSGTQARANYSRGLVEVHAQQAVLNNLCTVNCVNTAYRINPTDASAPTMCRN